MKILNTQEKIINSERIPSLSSFNIENDDFPTAEFVVCKSRDGLIVSRYGDMVWDFTIYHPDGKPSSLIFRYWDEGEFTPEREIIVEEIKHIFFILIWLRDRQPLSIGTLRNYLAVARSMAKFAETTKKTIKAIIGDEKELIEFIKYNNSGWSIETLSSLLINLLNCNSKHAINIVNRRVLSLFKKQNKQYRGSLKQHAPIPSKIYSDILTNLLDYLNKWEKIEEEILQMAYECHIFKVKKGDAKTYSYQYQSITEKITCELKDYIVERTGNVSIKEMASLITDAQCICKIIIQAYTGMRDEEAQSLPYHCIEETTSNSQIHYLINGRTTKLNNGMAKPTKWVTNSEGCRAVKVAQRIADSIYKIHNDIPLKKDTNIFEYPLFISSSYFGLTGKKIEETVTKYRIGTLYSKQGINSLVPKILNSDIEELEQIDPHRAWRSEEKFQVGQCWNLTSHQLRRSLALYAQRSGLVSLPSLRRQLQHITNEMSSYYAKGSAFAKNLIDEDDSHFANEWQKTQTESSSLGYIFNVLMTDTVLYGGHVHWVENTLRDGDGTILVDRKKTVQRFKSGEIAYKETIIGGCTKVGACNITATNWLQINCLKDNCRNLVVNLPKLERVIKAQEKMIKFLDITSLEYRTESSHLEILKTTRQKIFELKGK